MSKKWLIAVYLANLAIVIYFWWLGTSEVIAAGGAGIRLALARLAGLLGAFSILTQYTLISTAPWVNKTLGQYKLTNAHTINGKVAFTLIVTHIILIKSVYSNPLALPYVWLAAIAFTILIATVGAAILRKYLPYKIWHTIHLLNYTIAALVIWHQLANGGSLLANRAFRYYWIAINILALGNLIYFRLLKPRLKLKPS